MSINNLNRVQLLTNMLKKEPNDCFLNYAYALELVKENRLPEAIECLQTIIKTSPDYLASYYQLGKLLEQNNNKTEAAQIYQQGISLAQAQKNFKTLGELEEALDLMD